MKKFIQLSLVFVLMFVLFQAVTAGSVVSSSSLDSNVSNYISSPLSTSAESVQMAACLVNVKGVPCAQPAVGWNS